MNFITEPFLNYTRHVEINRTGAFLRFFIWREKIWAKSVLHTFECKKYFKLSEILFLSMQAMKLGLTLKITFHIT